MFARLYEWSKSENNLTKNLFWSILVIINASLGFIMSFQIKGEIFGQISGILIWAALYILVISNIYKNIQNTIYQKSIFFGYMWRTFIIVVTYFIIIIGLISGFDTPDFGQGIEILIGYYSIEISNLIGFNGSYFVATLIHGGIASILTFIIGNIFYGISKVWLTIKKNCQNGHRE